MFDFKVYAACSIPRKLTKKTLKEVTEKQEEKEIVVASKLIVLNLTFPLLKNK